MSMGGTIASGGEPRLNITNYGGQGVRGSTPRWVHDLPELAGIARVTTEDLVLPLTAKSTETLRRLAKKWPSGSTSSLKIFRLTASSSSRHEYHGEPLYYMDLVVKTEKPIVLSVRNALDGLSGAVR